MTFEKVLLKRFVIFTVMITKLSQKFEYRNKRHLYLHMLKKKRVYHRVTIPFATNSMLAEIRTPIIIGLDQQIMKRVFQLYIISGGR